MFYLFLIILVSLSKSIKDSRWWIEHVRKPQREPCLSVYLFSSTFTFVCQLVKCEVVQSSLRTHIVQVLLDNTSWSRESPGQHFLVSMFLEQDFLVSKSSRTTLLGVHISRTELGVSVCCVFQPYLKDTGEIPADWAFVKKAGSSLLDINHDTPKPLKMSSLELLCLTRQFEVLRVPMMI